MENLSFYGRLYLYLFVAAVQLSVLTKGRANREIADGNLGWLIVFTAFDAVSLFLLLYALRQALLLLGWVGS